MIDISDKDIILRIAKATGEIFLKKETIDRIKQMDLKKGDALSISRIAAIIAIKKVPELIPLCHPIPINHISLEYKFQKENSIKVICTVKSYSKTGVEMEALTGVSIALLNIWDIVKMYEKNDKGQYPTTIINNIIVEEKIKQS